MGSKKVKTFSVGLEFETLPLEAPQRQANRDHFRLVLKY